jgi:hypothetical protein
MSGIPAESGDSQAPAQLRDARADTRRTPGQDARSCHHRRRRRRRHCNAPQHNTSNPTHAITSHTYGDSVMTINADSTSVIVGRSAGANDLRARHVSYSRDKTACITHQHFLYNVAMPAGVPAIYRARISRTSHKHASHIPRQATAEFGRRRSSS